MDLVDPEVQEETVLVVLADPGEVVLVDPGEVVLVVLVDSEVLDSRVSQEVQAVLLDPEEVFQEEVTLEATIQEEALQETREGLTNSPAFLNLGS